MESFEFPFLEDEGHLTTLVANPFRAGGLSWGLQTQTSGDSPKAHLLITSRVRSTLVWYLVMGMLLRACHGL